MHALMHEHVHVIRLAYTRKEKNQNLTVIVGKRPTYEKQKEELEWNKHVISESDVWLTVHRNSVWIRKSN